MQATNSGINGPDNPQTSLDKVSPTMDCAKDSSWNTRHMGLRMGTDAISAASAAVLVAPLITMIDKYF
jgi:hypothetical protein